MTFKYFYVISDLVKSLRNTAIRTNFMSLRFVTCMSFHRPSQSASAIASASASCGRPPAPPVESVPLPADPPPSPLAECLLGPPAVVSCDRTGRPYISCGPRRVCPVKSTARRVRRAGSETVCLRADRRRTVPLVTKGGALAVFVGGRGASRDLFTVW